MKRKRKNSKPKTAKIQKKKKTIKIFIGLRKEEIKKIESILNSSDINDMENYVLNTYLISLKNGN